MKTGSKPKLETHGRHLSLAFFERVNAACSMRTPTCETTASSQNMEEHGHKQTHPHQE